MNAAHFRAFAVVILPLAGAFKLLAADPADSKSAINDQHSQAARLKWNLETLVGDYGRYGRHSAKWDESAKKALTAFAEMRSRTNLTQDADLSDLIGTAVAKAMTNGCNDPLVRYLNARFGMETSDHREADHVEQYRLAADELSKSQYAPVRKFYAALRASEQLNPGGTNTPPAVHEWRRKASQFLNEAVKDKTTPVMEVYEACEELLRGVNGNKVEFGQFYYAFEPAVFTNWPAESSLFLLKGTFYKDYAWQARGGTYANKVTETGWQLFAERLAEAEKALNQAWKLNPRDERTAKEMITVELGQGKGRARMEQWFKRGNDLNPDYYDIFYAKLYYLEPKWYGSPEDMLEFGRECVASKKWGGHVPLILRDAHEALAKYVAAPDREKYWKQPEVWADLKSAFEKFFKLNPEETGWRHNYAQYAYRAEDWGVLNHQLPLLGYTNFEFFGGQQEFEKMVRAAQTRIKK